MNKTKRQVEEAHRELYERSENGEISDEEITSVIEDLIGYDERTIDKYRKIFNKKGIIEEVDDNTFSVEEPSTPKQEFEGPRDTISTKVTLPRDLKHKAEKMGLDKSAILERALAERVGSLEDYAERFCDISEDFMIEWYWAMIEEGLHTVEGHKSKQEKRDERRKTLFKEISGFGGAPASVDRHRANAMRMAIRAGIE
jgi:hypothetical protein